MILPSHFSPLKHSIAPLALLFNSVVIVVVVVVVVMVVVVVVVVVVAAAVVVVALCLFLQGAGVFQLVMQTSTSGPACV